MTTLLDTFLDRLSAAPRLWNLLRWLVEAGYQGEQLAIARELRPWAGDQRSFLDLGCGTGAFADQFPAERYVGVDPSVGYLRFAIRHRPGRYLACSGQALALASQSFDAALVCGVLHHLPDPIARAVMIELARVLRPGSTLLIMEDIPPPAGDNLPGQLMHQLDRGGYIRDQAAYQAIFGSDFDLVRAYTMRSGICDYAVYVVTRHP